MTDAEWTAIFVAAGATKAAAGDLPVTNGIVGRWISILATKLAKFYAAHAATLNPYLTQAAIAALQALITNLPAILAVNPPGPE